MPDSENATRPGWHLFRLTAVYQSLLGHWPPKIFEPLEVTLLDHLQVPSKWLQRMTALVGVLLAEPLTEVNWL